MPKIVENAYVRRLREIARAAHEELTRAATEHMRTDGARSDAYYKHTSALVVAGARVSTLIDQETGKAFDRLAPALVKSTAKALRGISPHDIGLGPVVDAARTENIALMRRAGREYADNVGKIVEAPENFGLHVEALKEKILPQLSALGEKAEARAELIARDQTLKLNAGLTQTRMQAVGITRYTWSTSGDERVREAHAEVNGQEFDFATGAPVGSDGENLNPGEDFQCRCVALPVWE